MLLGLVKPDSGKFDIGETVNFGYFSQDGLKFRDDQKVIDIITDIADYIDLGGGRNSDGVAVPQLLPFHARNAAQLRGKTIGWRKAQALFVHRTDAQSELPNTRRAYQRP